jgi:hypothetical protein
VLHSAEITATGAHVTIRGVAKGVGEWAVPPLAPLPEGTGGYLHSVITGGRIIIIIIIISSSSSIIIIIIIIDIIIIILLMLLLIALLLPLIIF